MFERLPKTIIAAAIVVVMGAFSLSNALALTIEAEEGVALTSAAVLCEEATATIYDDVDVIYERALSLGWSKEMIQERVSTIKDYWRQVCAEAEAEAEAAAQPLTTAEQWCVERSERIYGAVNFVYDQGLSLGWSNEMIQERVLAIKDEWRLACNEAGIDPYSMID